MGLFIMKDGHPVCACMHINWRTPVCTIYASLWEREEENILHSIQVKSLSSPISGSVECVLRLAALALWH